ncbi:MAG: hypothetical protein GF364_05065 [Candidatus Lokiarchaeota archaeon]|nr:hypothetical protein [Candidatus Lokiarchaeota archaeon]
MMYFSLLRSDWFEISLILFTALFVFVVILKLIQYYVRWGNFKANNLQYSKGRITIQKKDSLGIINLRFIQVCRKENNLHSYRKSKRILVFTPYLIRKSRMNFLASALAEANYNVYLMSSAEFLNKLGMNEKKSRKYVFSQINQLFRLLNIEIIIGFDMINALILDYLQNYKDSNGKIINKNDIDDRSTRFIKSLNQSPLSLNAVMPKVVISIRPIVKTEDMSMLHYIPFTYRWFYTLFAFIRSGFRNIMKFYPEFSIQSLLKMELKHRVFLIIPEKTPKTTKITQEFFLNEKIELKKKQNMFELLRFEQGGFRFNKQETIVYAKLLRFIDESFV